MLAPGVVRRHRVVPLIPAQDFKRVGDDDTGPNTGGMGAYAPMTFDAATVDGLLDGAVLPLVEELRRRGIDYRGVLYAGLMLTEDGPKVIEYNVRFGDPETQVVLRSSSPTPPPSSSPRPRARSTRRTTQVLG